MVRQKRRREETTDTEPAMVKALRQVFQEVEELREERDRSREEIEGLKLKIAKLEAGCRTPQEEEKEVKLPTEVWVRIAKKLNKNDVCSFALVSKQLREAQVLAYRFLVTSPCSKYSCTMVYFTEDWCVYWSRKFNVRYTDPEVIKQVFCVAAGHGYLQVFEKYWSQGPQKKLSNLWDERTCDWAAYGGHLEVIKWLRAKGCPWDVETSFMAAYGGHLELVKWLRAKGCPWNEKTSSNAAHGGHLEVLQWLRAQDPPCPWDDDVCYYAAGNGHLDVLRWARRQGCPWDTQAPCAAAKNGHLKVLKWLIKEGCPYDKSWCRRYAVKGGECAREVLEWLDE
ncbi:ankyrin repeat protein [Chloropicon roscoffensis]|uniref:Ankyrin repeat protein n=1 Tax=Chloropicon roscoffensis TaxID=1461544 RepID=A0AAX4P8D9_9CHLO